MSVRSGLGRVAVDVQRILPGRLRRLGPVSQAATLARQAATNPTRPATSRDVLGFDLMRFAAMAAVLAEHLLGIAHHPLSNEVPYYLHPGQLGVAMFLALSGFLALRGGRSETISAWLGRRLQRIYIPYWIALTAVLALNAAGRYKPVTPSLIVAEYLGVAPFTHASDLIGVHFWFIPVIVLCYLGAALLRWGDAFWPILLVASLFGHPDAGLHGHFLAFLCGAVLGRIDTLRPTWVVPAGVVACAAAAAALAALAGNDRSQAVYPLLGTVCLLAARCVVTTRRAPRLASASKATYEFYLIHVPVLLVVERVGHFGLLSLTLVGIPACLAATLGFSRLTLGHDWGQSRIPRR